MDIQRATVEDIEKLQSIGRQTFAETFASLNSEANMRKYLDEEFSTARLTAELNDENAGFYFARFDGGIIGYLKLNFGQSQTELQDEKAVEIERIYVLKAFQGKNIGQLLYKKALQIAREKKADYIWLGVWEQNQRAINFYTKNGFVPFGTHVFKLGDAEQTDIMMKLDIKDGAEN